jgi:tetratricopeptide (TPR) repeat protein
MKILRSISLSTLLVLSNGLSILPRSAIAAPKLCNPQSNRDYELCMQLGYQTSIQRDNKNTALENFKRALKLRPKDTNATKAIRNIELQIQQGNVIHVTPSGIGAPSNRAQAATRKQNCLDGKKLVALIPEKQLGLTAMERPTLLFHIPPTSAPTLKVTLEDKSRAKLYTKIMNTPAKTDYVQFKFSDFKDSPSLTPGETYQWTFTLVCDPKDPSANVTVFGNIQRIELDPILTIELKAAKPVNRAILYAMNGLWYDTLAILAEAIQSDPNNSQLTEDWQELMKSSGLQKLL